MLNKLNVQEKLKQFYIEDNHYGDLATSIFDVQQCGTLTIVSKAEGIFCGTIIINESFKLIEPSIHIDLLVEDGDTIQQGQTLAIVQGHVQTLLTMERITLNLIQRMSGIATMTNEIVSKVRHTGVQIVDTRKTTPGLGMFEKYAVQVGGGYNHRRTLNDGIMLKDNHIAYSESLSQAVLKAKTMMGPMDKIEVEIETLEALDEAIQVGVDIIMFDNRSPSWIQQYITRVPSNIKTEASGNININNVIDYANTGVNYISIGAIFYTQRALDISAKVVM
ncbi:MULTISPECIES: carboxylating nicotinate-nucleotide diphosphorylase [Staphylococcus]|uniref:nicotinate-nucleotide diphosphorylase (carboxylating) n=1 Tax=Staphylococcus succinus TaxID=61015 RepID=A0ABX5IQC9_9STAP|nr:MULTISPECIES: carboxylating nicotinate-nucleotide diphosphorylase [Staphylococcus]MDH9160563.1 carboxylating nicotinate-nucleotide diphosphorylase [Staphylococcus succinus]MEB8123787.1 carboxylating nicotinate-nucleotide diphosphorylase [Staphylococcus succinus]OIJ31361.1 nicotinate-nucleotide diphosphorylase (carboxylating) [Staphylococcus sp. LCT-H4]PNZ23510.1 nicotinate-nucleotide diphosphorylase (carboxylating) [Staphylococcus succinus subsp. succinus]PTI70272.1 carboxylating nicotinate